MHDQSAARRIRAALSQSALSQRSLARLEQFCDHLDARAANALQLEDYIAFGSLSSLERLQHDLRKVAPEICGPLRLAMRELRREKTRRAGPQGDGGRRGPVPRFSVPVEALPSDWRVTLAEMRRLRDDKDRGLLLPARTVTPPTVTMIADLTYLLRNIASCALGSGHSVELTRPVIDVWRAQAEARGRAATGVAFQLRLLRRFVLFRDGGDPLAAVLSGLAEDYGRRGARSRKAKERFLLHNPVELGDVMLKADALRAAAQAAPAGSRQKTKLTLHAAALALPLVLPLRVGDLHRLQIGTSLMRDASRWSVSLTTSKTGAAVERDDLWPEVTPFLDAALLIDSADHHIWRAYDARHGTPFFSRDGGDTALSKDWISDVWYQHIGTGAHVVRTLWHELAADSARDRTWIALAMCGQKSERTAAHYRLRSAHKRAADRGRGIMKARRQNARHDHG